MYGIGFGIGAIGASTKRSESSSVLPYINGLKLYVDAGNTLSYSGSGTTINDLSGGGFNGTLVNGVSFDTDGGGSLVFDGIDDKVTFGTYTQIQPIPKRTIQMYIKLDSASLGSAFLSDGNYGSDTNGVQFYFSSNTARIGLESASGGSAQYSVLGTFSRSVWVNHAVTFDGTNIKYYINGVLTSTIAQTNSPTNGVNPTVLGVFNGYTQYMKGKISQVLIYNDDIGVTNILSNHNKFKSRYGL